MVRVVMLVMVVVVNMVVTTRQDRTGKDSTDIQTWLSRYLVTSAQQGPQPDPLPGISFDTRPGSVLEIIG